jgi:hypothetical protein
MRATDNKGASRRRLRASGAATSEDAESIQAAVEEAKRMMCPRGCDEPDWAPLEAVLPIEHRGGFMFIGYALGGIRMYKHGITRQYLMLLPADEIEGSPWEDSRGAACSVRDHPAAIAFSGGGDTPDKYRVIPVAWAVELAFEGIERLTGGVADPREVNYDQAYRAERDAALAAAGWTVIS